MASPGPVPGAAHRADDVPVLVVGAGPVGLTMACELKRRGVDCPVVPDGATREVRSGWLVGCDGAHSTVRRRLNLPFEGARYEELFLLADVRMSTDLTRDRIHMLLGPGGPMPAFPLPGPGQWRLIEIA